MSLSSMALRADLTGVLGRLKALSAAEAMDELLLADPTIATTRPLHFVMLYGASLDLITAICDVMDHDHRKPKINLFAMPTPFGSHALHFCAGRTFCVQVLQLTIDKFPPALLLKSAAHSFATPIEIAQARFSSSSSCSRRGGSGEDDRAVHLRDVLERVVTCLERNIAKHHITPLNQLTVKLCLIEMKRQGMTDFVASRADNELTTPQFVFRVLDLFVNSGMKIIAEDIVSYVGTNVGI